MGEIKRKIAKELKVLGETETAKGNASESTLRLLKVDPGITRERLTTEELIPSTTKHALTTIQTQVSSRRRSQTAIPHSNSKSLSASFPKLLPSEQKKRTPRHTSGQSSLRRMKSIRRSSPLRTMKSNR